ncbi:MAG TPA: endonuclease domain-containing protein [Veillonellaceae bacterium]|nr:endonuclease domain-containing protein [Veillonellaceae bacterium]
MMPEYTPAPFNKEMKKRSQSLRRKMTEAESKLWYQCLKKHYYHFHRQYVISSFIADFYCPSARLAIELDGSQHYSEMGLRYDQWRTGKLNDKGIAVLRFTNLDVFKKFDDVKDYIDYITTERLKKLGKSI